MNRPAELRRLINYYASDIMTGYAHLIYEDRKRYAAQVIEHADHIKHLAQEVYQLTVEAEQKEAQPESVD
jgi:hypothetical protein